MRKHLVRPSTELRLLSHGLLLDLYSDEEVVNPREYANSVLVGVDIEIPNRISKGNNFDDLVQNYCRDILGCDKTDIIWRGVHKYEYDSDKEQDFNRTQAHDSLLFLHDHTEFAFANETSLWDNTVIGFIYQTKRSIYHKYEITHINSAIESIVVAELKDEIERYTRFSNNEMYELVIGGDHDNHYETASSIDGTLDRIDAAANQVIDSIVDDVDNIISDVEITLEYDLFFTKPYTPYMAVIGRNFFKTFGIHALFGKPTINEEERTITVRAASDSLPYMSLIIADCTTCDIASTIREVTKLFIENGKGAGITSELIEAHITSKRYTEHHLNVPPALNEVFFHALLSLTKGVKYVKGTKSVK